MGVVMVRGKREVRGGGGESDPGAREIGGNLDGQIGDSLGALRGLLLTFERGKGK